VKAAGPQRFQSGFGLIESLTGLVVFIILAMAGTQAFRGVIANQKETAQVKALTDAVTVTAERLSALNVKALTAAGSKYLAWSAPEALGSGEYQFRYRAVPKPSVAGLQDTSIVGMEVEVGPLSKGVFSASRSFATLIAPHLSSKDAMGQTSTKAERDEEASFYASLKNEIAAVAKTSKGDNQVRLNSFNCYDKGQCCGYMKEYFMNPKLEPKDGLDEKCHYRCAVGGDVSVADWNSACHTDFCALAPWRSKEACCTAIAAGECKPGTVCANVCIDCQHEDGSTCGPPACDGGWWNDMVDCAKGTMCDGSPMPATMPGYGDPAALCKLDACKKFGSNCELRKSTCCNEYWSVLARGDTPSDKAANCATISKKEECCDWTPEEGYWDFSCAGGKIVKFKYKNYDQWYCGSPNPAWDRQCAVQIGCGAVTTPPGAGGPCGSWTQGALNGEYDDPFPGSPGVHFVVVEAGAGGSTTTSGGATTSKTGDDRKATHRSGSPKNSDGGRE